MAAQRYTFRYKTEGRASALASRLAESETTTIRVGAAAASSSSPPASSSTSPSRDSLHGIEHEATSVRWFHLARAVYLETVVSSFPAATVHDVEYLLDLFDWLLGKGQKLGDQEFSVAWQRWKSRGGGRGAAARRRGSSVGDGERVASEVTEEKFRRILSRRGFGERKVDLVLSVLIKECNAELLAEKGPSIDEEWIRIVHEIFFVLDSPGYGYITIEELRHLVASMVQAMPLGSSRGDRSFASEAFVESATIDLALRMGGILLPCSYPVGTPSPSPSASATATATATATAENDQSIGLAGKELLKDTRHGAFTVRDGQCSFCLVPALNHTSTSASLSLLLSPSLLLYSCAMSSTSSPTCPTRAGGQTGRRTGSQGMQSFAGSSSACDRTARAGERHVSRRPPVPRPLHFETLATVEGLR